MTRSVFANNRNFSHVGSGDTSLSSAPDVCKTPMGNSIPPIPYGVSSQAGDLAGATTTVTIDGHPTAIASSIHTRCSGDQAGSATGVASGTTGDKTHFVSYSFDVKAEGEGVVRHMDATTMNNRNTIGMTYGAATAPVDIPDDVIEPLYTLRFQVVDELGQPLQGIKYQTVAAATPVDGQENPQKTTLYGKTTIASTEKDESIDCYILWENFSATPDGQEG